MKLHKLGALLGLTLLLGACGDTSSVAEREHPKSDITVEEVSDSEEKQVEVWEETDEDTGITYEVTNVKQIKDGKVIRSTQTKEPIGEDLEEKESDEQESDSDEQEFENIGEITSEEEAEKLQESGLVFDIKESVVIKDKDGNIVEEIEVSEDKE